MLGRTAEHVKREAAEPVLAHVVAAADAYQPYARVPFGCLDQDGAPPIVRRERFGDAPQTPGPAQVEPIQVDDLPVAAVAHYGRRKQLRWPTFCQTGQEAREPVGKV